MIRRHLVAETYGVRFDTSLLELDLLVVLAGFEACHVHAVLDGLPISRVLDLELLLRPFVLLVHSLVLKVVIVLELLIMSLVLVLEILLLELVFPLQLPDHPLVYTFTGLSPRPA